MGRGTPACKVKAVLYYVVNCKVGCTHISLLFIVFGIYNFDKTFKYVDKHKGNETGIGIA